MSNQLQGIKTALSVSRERVRQLTKENQELKNQLMKTLIDFNLPESDYNPKYWLYIVEDKKADFSIESQYYLLKESEDKPSADSHLNLGSLEHIQDEWLSYSDGDMDWEEFKDEFWGRLIEDKVNIL